jgi:uncharacterized protein (TIGR02271 family)
MTTPTPNRFEIGATVRALDGQVGTLEAVTPQVGTEGGACLVVRPAEGGRALDVPLALVDTGASTPEVIQLTVDRASLTYPVATAAEDGDRFVVPVVEEQLTTSTRPAELGRVLVHRRVEPEPVEATVDLARDEVAVERVRIDRPIDAVPKARYEGETLIVPVVEEVLVTENRLMLREAVRITRRRVTEPTTVRDTVRRTVVEFEEVAEGESPTAGPESAAAPSS